MRFLPALLTVLLVADASFLLVHSQRSTDEPESNETSTDQPIYTETDGPESTTSGYDTTTDYNPQVNRIQCGITFETVYYLQAFEHSSATFEISSNTTENTNYTNNQYCKAQFNTGPKPVWLSVYLEFLDLENSTYCSYDWLLLKGAKFCGRTSDPKFFSYVVPAYQTFTIKFQTDGSVTATGFRLTVSTSEATSDAVSYEPYGVISNPDEITNYQEVNQGDYVDLGNDDTYNLTPSFDYPTSGYTSERPYNSIIECSNGNTDNYYYLVDNNYGNSDSYYAQYISNNNRYLFRSPNFGYGDYGNNTSCKVKFYTGFTRQRLTVYFNVFDVESAIKCRYDSLCMGGVKYCSTWPQGRYFTYEIAPYSSFTLDFETDNSVAKSGFEASLTFENVYATYGSYEATSGDGSSEDTVVYSYVDQYSYQDRCASDYYNTPSVYNPEPSTPEPRFDFQNSFVDVAKSKLSEAENDINIVEELIDNLDSPQSQEYPQYPQYLQYRK